MSEPIISVEGLSKRYIIGHQGDKGDGLRHAIEQAVRVPVRWAQRGFRRDPVKREDFWALKDVDFDIQQGEMVGVVGRNGAGKSTLLKLLSRITEPTSGRITMRGRVASLLEVGTGFHPELTGRENVFLNGAILGMSRIEIKSKFDEIIAFANIEKFLDTPVKRYSSGMYVRLAFAVAAHLEPEILIVDEVLAVGDAQFQKKCLQKMDDVGTSGRTVIFVSHNMQAVTRICKRCLLLEQGKLIKDGSASDVTRVYMGSSHQHSSAREWKNQEEAPGDDVVRLRAVRVRNDSGELGETFDIRHSVGIEIEWEAMQDGFVTSPHFVLTNETGVHLFVSVDLDPEWRGRERPKGRYISTGWIPGNLLAEGAFSVAGCIMTLEPTVFRVAEWDSAMFTVTSPLTAPDTARGDYGGILPGVMRPKLRWETEALGQREPVAAGRADD